MHQQSAPTRDPCDSQTFRVPAPHSYDGIGQALRAAFRDHRDPPDSIGSILRQLDTID